MDSHGLQAEVAADLVTERLTKGIRSGYHFVLAERGSTLVGYACYGPIFGTQGSFELYWIAVAPEEQRRGLGAQVYARAEAAMCKAGAQHIYADQNYEYPVRAGIKINPTIAGYGTLKPDSTGLAKIAEQKKAAANLVDKVGFDN